MLDILGYIGAIIVLSTYWYSNRTGNMQPFNLGNVVGSMMLIGGQIAAGVWYGAAVSGAFGIIGLYGLIKTQRRNRNGDLVHI